MVARIRIVSDGTGTGTRIYAGNGDDISAYFSHVQISISSEGIASAVLVAEFVQADVVAEVSAIKPPENKS